MNLKVCGMRDLANIAGLVKLKPDYIGFIFYEKSRRFTGNDFSPEYTNQVPASIKKVGVFVNQSGEEIVEKISIYSLDMVQLHGDESSEFVKELKEKIGNVQVIKAFGVDENFDFDSLKAYKPLCDYFLFDTKVAEYGGSGKSFDRSLLMKYDNEIPFFLSGGIGPEELKNIDFSGLNIHAVDINSKVETEPGMKNLQLVEEVKNLLMKSERI